MKLRKPSLIIYLRSFESDRVDRATKRIASHMVGVGAQMIGPVPMPTKKERYTVNRSTHVDKKSREQFETWTHKRVMIIMDPTSQIAESLRQLEIEPGVEVTVKSVAAGSTADTNYY